MGGAVSSGRDNAELIDNLRGGNYIRTRDVERVFRALDRGDYMTPEAREQAYKDLAWRNGPLHMSAPCIYSEVMEGLELRPGLSFLNVGSGTGYLSTLVGLILGSGGINHGVEVHPVVIDYASKKLVRFLESSPTLDEFDFCEPKFYHGNGLCLAPLQTAYDRVYCGAACPEEYQSYFRQLIKIGGVLVMPLNDNLLQVKRTGPTEWASKSLLNVSFASLRVPTKDEAQELIRLDEQSPVRLQQMARAVIRASMLESLYHTHPSVRSPPPPPPPTKKTCPRRICIPIDDDSDNDLNALHDMDRNGGANEMNALLSLVLSMGHNRVAGALRVDTLDSDTSSSLDPEEDEEDGRGSPEILIPNERPNLILQDGGYHTGGNGNNRRNMLMFEILERHRANPELLIRSRPPLSSDSEDHDHHSDEGDRSDGEDDSELREDNSVQREENSVQKEDSSVQIEENLELKEDNSVHKEDNSDQKGVNSVQIEENLEHNEDNSVQKEDYLKQKEDNSEQKGDNSNKKDKEEIESNLVKNKNISGDTESQEASTEKVKLKERELSSEEKEILLEDKPSNSKESPYRDSDSSDRPSTSKSSKNRDSKDKHRKTLESRRKSSKKTRRTSENDDNNSRNKVPCEVELCVKNEAGPSTMEWESSEPVETPCEEDADTEEGKEEKRQKLDSGIGEENSPSGGSESHKNDSESDDDSRHSDCPSEGFDDSNRSRRRRQKRGHLSTRSSSSTSRSSGDRSRRDRAKRRARTDRSERPDRSEETARRNQLSTLMKRSVRELPLPLALQQYVNLERPLHV